MARLKNIRPDEILLEEFLNPLEISAYKLSKDIDIPQTRISQIIRGSRCAARVAVASADRYKPCHQHLNKTYLHSYTFQRQSAIILTSKYIV